MPRIEIILILGFALVVISGLVSVKQFFDYHKRDLTLYGVVKELLTTAENQRYIQSKKQAMYKLR